MNENLNKPAILDEIISSKIYIIRNKKVMLDEDLAELYGVETRRLNEFAPSGWGGRRKLPYAFTEQGVAMLSGVLNSERAIKVNIQIMRVFTKFRSMLETHKEILIKLEQIEKKDIEQDEAILTIFNYIKALKGEEEDAKPITVVKGFKKNGD